MDEVPRYCFAALLLLLSTFCCYRAIVVWDSGKTDVGIHQAIVTALCLGSLAGAYFMIYPPT